ncbi:SecDF P1 head subdomain-containing protein [Actinokineospora diospyrosa]|uniref:SecDF P1 head subdomain domain-containing protein n=1 Tax=Actinokineospora diospyrosa TaxID=103728 RepID=A0ABT1I6J8_9PSEU|nr:hypothetical protein [Actinokineospora diospyrosa]MCP2268239.1 hypothetical protein [Actinokineospora diospyrosa]
MRKTMFAAVVAALLLVLTACGGEPVAGAPTEQPGSGPVKAKVPVELRPVTSVKPGLEVSGADEVIGPDDTVYTLAPSIGEFTEFEDVRPEKTDYGWVITIKLPPATSALFTKWTTEHVDEQLAIMVDGTLVSAPRIASPITGGSLQISGNFTEDSAKKLAADITGGTP